VTGVTADLQGTDDVIVFHNQVVDLATGEVVIVMQEDEVTEMIDHEIGGVFL